MGIFYEAYHVVVQCLLFLVIWEIFYQPDRGRKAVAAAGIFLAANMLLKLCLSAPAWARYAALAVLVLGYCRARYGKHLEKAVFVILLHDNLQGLCLLIENSIFQYAADSVLSGIDARSEDYIARVYQEMAVCQGVCMVFYTLVFLAMAGAVKKAVRKPFDMSWHDVVFLSALNIVGGMLARMILEISVVPIDKEVFFLFDEKREMAWKVPAVSVLLCMGEISAIYIYRKYRELQEERQKHFVEEQQMKAMKRRLEEAESFYGSIRRVRHEMKGHMTNIKGLVAGEKYGEVEKYIEELDETIQELDYRFHTGNAVTDVIVNDKYRRAAKSGISFQVKFHYAENITIPAFDIGIVLNNLLDNAIEACGKLEQEKRHMSLVLKRKDNFLLIEVENSFDGVLKWEDGDTFPATTKEGRLPDVLMEHGIGLKNVKDVAKRYLGDMDIKLLPGDGPAGEDVFKVTVMLQQG